MLFEISDVEAPILEEAAKERGFPDLESFLQAFLTNAVRKHKLLVEAKAAEVRINQEIIGKLISKKEK